MIKYFLCILFSAVLILEAVIAGKDGGVFFILSFFSIYSLAIIAFAYLIGIGAQAYIYAAIVSSFCFTLFLVIFFKEQNKQLSDEFCPFTKNFVPKEILNKILSCDEEEAFDPSPMQFSMFSGNTIQYLIDERTRECSKFGCILTDITHQKKSIYMNQDGRHIVFGNPNEGQDKWDNVIFNKPYILDSKFHIFNTEQLFTSNYQKDLLVMIKTSRPNDISGNLVLRTLTITPLGNGCKLSDSVVVKKIDSTETTNFIIVNQICRIVRGQQMSW